MPQREQSGAESSRSGDSQKGNAEEWSGISDPTERRKIQNRLAQRRYRDKVRDQKEETERREENQRQAGSSYTTANPHEIDSGRNLSGLPWGGVSMRHILETGRTREQQSQQSQQSSRENSVYAANSSSRTGGSSRVGLQLTEQFARGHPAWSVFTASHPGWQQQQQRRQP